MKKILQVVHGLTFGGAEKMVFDYCMKLDKSKFIVYLVCFTHEDIKKEKCLEDNGVHFICVCDYMNASRVQLGLLNGVKRYLVVKKIIDEIKPDIIHTHLAINSYILFAKPAKGTHIIHTMHSDIERQWNGSLNNRIDYLSTKIIAKKYRMSILALNEKMRAEIIDKKINAKVYTILNGFELDAYKNIEDREKIRSLLSIPNNVTVIGAVGRLAAVKNYSFLVDIFIEFHKRNDHSFLIVVGEGPEKRSIETKLKENGIRNSDYVILARREDVPQIMSVMDVMLLTSFSESFSLVTVESQLVGTRCIVSDVVPRETQISNLVTYKNLGDGVNSWVDEIGECKKNICYYDVPKIDINNILKELEEIYLEN